MSLGHFWGTTVRVRMFRAFIGISPLLLARKAKKQNINFAEKKIQTLLMLLGISRYQEVHVRGVPKLLESFSFYLEKSAIIFEAPIVS